MQEGDRDGLQIIGPKILIKPHFHLVILINPNHLILYPQHSIVTVQVPESNQTCSEDSNRVVE